MKHFGFILAGFLVFVVSCSEHNNANKHMHSMDFEDLVKRFESPERDKWQKPETVLGLLGPLKGKTIAEIGAGTGYFTFRLAEKGATVIAGDVDDRFLDYIKNKKKNYPSANVSLLKIPMDDPAFEKNSFDKVLIVDTYHHIDKRSDYFGKLAGKMKEGAELVVIDFKKKTPVGPPDSMKINPSQVEDELKAAGFQNISLDEKSLPYQYIVRAKLQ